MVVRFSHKIDDVHFGLHRKRWCVSKMFPLYFNVGLDSLGYYEIHIMDLPSSDMQKLNSFLKKAEICT